MGHQAEAGDASYQQAMELINMGLKLDHTSPLQAIEYYQKGGDALSRVLEGAAGELDEGVTAEKIQRTLDMVEERSRFLTRNMMGRHMTDSQSTTASPIGSLDSTDQDDDIDFTDTATPHAFNLFNFADEQSLTRELRIALHSFGNIFAELMRCFGFQEESVRNQQEHLVTLLANASRETDVNGLTVLHRKVFSNYRTWTEQLQVTPQCSGDTDVLHNKATDLVLWFCIWGEAGNLRHVPECLCYIFHQMRTELWEQPDHLPKQKQPAGWYLSKVVAPLYRAMRVEFGKRTARGKPVGHTGKCNFDDINEFFWNSECLQYSYHSPEEGDLVKRHNLSGSAAAMLETFGGEAFDLQAHSAPEVSSMPMIKRYVERRTWLAPVRSFWRIFSFHLLMLHALLCFAFLQKERTGLVVDGALLQALCGTLLSHAGLSFVQELLSLFLQHGMLHTHAGQLGSLGMRLVVKLGAATAIGASYLDLLEDAPFSRCHVPPSQWVHEVLFEHPLFVTLALIYATPVLLSTTAQVFPAISTWVRSWRGFPKMLIDAIEPLNRLLLGKGIHVPQSEKIHYDFFWASLLLAKFAFSYVVQIQPLVKPTTDVWALDLSDWYPGVDLGKLPNMAVLFIRWSPIVLMYILDTQIWYMLWVAIWGTAIGWNMRIGEVPDFDTVRERMVSAARHFNRKLLSDEVPLIVEEEKAYTMPASGGAAPGDGGAPGGGAGGLSSAAPAVPMADLRQQLLLVDSGSELRNESFRYFAEAWSAIVADLRASDLLSNHEAMLLRFNQWEGAGFSRCTYMPAFCTAGKLNEAFHMAKALSDQAKFQTLRKRVTFEASLQNAVGADTEMREAVVEFWELSRWMLSELLGPRHAAALGSVFENMLTQLSRGQLLELLLAANLPKLSAAMVSLAKMLVAVELEEVEPSASPSASPASLRPSRKRIPEAFAIGKVVDALRNAIDAIKGVLARSQAALALAEEVESLKFTPRGFFWPEEEGYARAQMQELLLSRGAREKLRGLVMLCSTARLDARPTHIEVLRRLKWFVGSLFMEMPRPPPVLRMGSWTTLTPFYAEDIMYTARELAAKNEDGISVIYFLKTVHPNEWANFLERMGLRPSDEAKLWQDRRLALELRLWASFRGQTLARTVEGMMQHERALRLQASWEGIHGQALESLVKQKYQYVVSCQAYGQHRRVREPKAADTEFLLQRFANLRVAYVDKTSALSKVRGHDGASALRESIRYYSVLIKGALQGDEEVVQEVYRVQLPGDIMLGEGKPENQNHAIIFTRGESIQAIDMNQCGYLEEALKMRNLLQEFREHPGASMVGFREHIFTGELSSLASYMALQEGCFVTLTQRVLWNPLRVRLHYGHPDMFDKIYSITRGGVSKASRGVNLSEDIFAGFNHLLRGGTIPYVEYVQVGKGRDVGMQQIYKFEAKLASGNGEQCLSRDVYRAAQRLDFTRLLSFFYSGQGFYFNQAATVFAMFFFLYITLFSHVLQLDVGVADADLLNAQWVLQMGLLLTVPIFCFLALENGLRHALVQMWRVNITGSLLFFMFHMGTKAFYFDSTLKYGGAKYRPTGRGFVMRHEQFAELYRFYAGSHLYNGFELLWGLILLSTLGFWPHGHAAYWRTAWSLWAVALSWLASPFWFNPLAFDLKKNKEDLWNWLRWMERKDAAALTSWESWWVEEHEYISTGSWSKKVAILMPAVRYALTFVGIIAAMSHHSIHRGWLREALLFGKLFGGALLFAALAFSLHGRLKEAPKALRVFKSIVVAAVLAAVFILTHHFSLFEVIHLCIAAGYVCAALIRVPFALGSLPSLASHVCKAYDYLCGGLLIGACLLLSVTGFMKHVQNRALLSDAFNQGVQYAELSRLLPSD